VGLNSDYLGPALFNTPLEAGIRAVVLLEAFAPCAFDISKLSLLDYFVVHLRDAGGPQSVHPEIQSRPGEYFVRRQLVEQGVALMVRASLIEQVNEYNGIAFRTHETASAMVDLVTSRYNNELLDSAKWLAERAEKYDHNYFFRELRNRIDNWSHEALWTSTS